MRVIDLFRSWDDDGNGKINDKEFRKAITALGYSASKEDFKELFGVFDVDKSGEVDYNELNKALRRGATQELAPELRSGAVNFELTAKNKTPSRAKSTGSKKGGFTMALKGQMDSGAKGALSK